MRVSCNVVRSPLTQGTAASARNRGPWGFGASATVGGIPQRGEMLRVGDQRPPVIRNQHRPLRHVCRSLSRQDNPLSIRGVEGRRHDPTASFAPLRNGRKIGRSDDSHRHLAKPSHPCLAQFPRRTAHHGQRSDQLPDVTVQLALFDSKA